MTYPKLLALVTFLLFALIATLGFMKGRKTTSANADIESVSSPVAIQLETEVRELPDARALAEKQAHIKSSLEIKARENPVEASTVKAKPSNVVLPEVNNVEMLFNKGDPKFPFVETITYKSRVAWQKGRPAWLSDYAAHYATSRHFIARSLNGASDYIKQDLAEGDRFNVYRKDKEISFHLLVDLGRCRLWLYCIDADVQEPFLIKTYQVGLGRPDSSRVSGLLTPQGKYTLGNKVAVYKPKVQGFHNGKKVEMLRIFGSRWIPFDKEISSCTAPARGLGIHGVPWLPSAKGDLAEEKESLGKYESDGCIRLSTGDIEEIFAIIITKPAVIELVADFSDANLPGVK